MRRLSHLNILAVLLLVPALVLGTLLGGCAAKEPATAPTGKAPAAVSGKANWPKALSFSTTSVGSTLYVLAAGISDMITKYLKLPANVEVAGGAPAAMQLLGDGLVNMSVMPGMNVMDAYLGIRTLDKPFKIRAIQSGYTTVFHLMTRANSGIKTVSDMSGRSFQYSKPGSANTDYGDTLIKCANLKNIKSIPWESTAASAKVIADGTVDVSCTSSIGSADVRQLILTTDTYLVGLSEEISDCMVKSYPGYIKAVIPKNYYEARGGGKYPPSDIPQIGAAEYVVCRADMPDDLVYEIAKVVMDHPEEFANYHTEAKEFRLENATKSPIVPFHPGAVRYFKEKGVWTDELQKTQDRLLAAEPK